MASVLPPPAKRQRREYLERSKTQQDVTPKSKPDGVFHAHFVDPEGNQLGDNVAIPFSHGSEKDVSQALNLLLERVCLASVFNPLFFAFVFVLSFFLFLRTQLTHC